LAVRDDLAGLQCLLAVYRGPSVFLNVTIGGGAVNNARTARSHQLFAAGNLCALGQVVDGFGDLNGLAVDSLGADVGCSFKYSALEALNLLTRIRLRGQHALELLRLTRHARPRSDIGGFVTHGHLQVAAFAIGDFQLLIHTAGQHHHRVGGAG
jgi:hypothetical protein